MEAAFDAAPSYEVSPLKSPRNCGIECREKPKNARAIARLFLHAYSPPRHNRHVSRGLLLAAGSDDMRGEHCGRDRRRMV